MNYFTRKFTRKLTQDLFGNLSANHTRFIRKFTPDLFGNLSANHTRFIRKFTQDLFKNLSANHTRFIQKLIHATGKGSEGTACPLYSTHFSLQHSFLNFLIIIQVVVSCSLKGRNLHRAGFARVRAFECVLYRASVPVPVLDEKFYYT